MNIADGIKFVRDITNSETSSEKTSNDVPKPQSSSSNGDSMAYNAKGGTCPDILIIDVDSADSR